MQGPRSFWRCMALLPLYLLSGIVLLEALVVGSWSDQTAAAWVLLIGALALAATATAAVVATRRRIAIRRWIFVYIAILAGTLALVIVSWLVTDALRNS